MELEHVLAALAVLLAWAGTIYIVRRFGAGFGARSVVCPHLQQRASLSTFWTTRGGWGRAVSCDAVQCSLLPGGMPVTCDKSCLAQLNGARVPA